MIAQMIAPQSGIFALGTASHAYLELDLRGLDGELQLVSAVAGLREPRTTMGVSRTDQDRFGEIFRRNMPYGIVTDHGTMFVGFAAAQRPLQAMLESMAGLPDGVRDALTYFTRALTGAYYFVPSLQGIRRFAR